MAGRNRLRRPWRMAIVACLAVATLLVPAAAGQPEGSPPSAHCHVTDGVFTVCPDGSREWSDVPARAFPDTHAFLYADQADLDRALASPGSPADTFMLMYDECGRTTPLGPDEYFLVSFDTVEDEGGETEDVRYAVHVFADGTLIFFENGEPVRDEDGQLRVREIEGQRGDASFGPSPRCAADHLVVEYEIKLTATGLRLNGGYSPDPIFWGAEPPNRPPTAVDDAGKVEDDPLTIDVLANDTDPDDAIDPSTLTIVSPPEKGTATVSGGSIVYTKGPDFEDTDTLRYTVADSQGATSNPATVQLTSCPPGRSYPVTLPFVRTSISLVKPWIVEYDPLPLTFTTRPPPAGAYCSATSSVGTLNVFLRCNPLSLPPLACPLPAVLLRLQVATSTATAALDFFRAQDAPVVPVCDWVVVRDSCLLNAGGGGTYVRWTTPGFQITDAFTGTLSYDTGPHTYWANLGPLAAADAPLGTKIQNVESYFHRTLISRLSSVDRLALVQDPPADVLVTDPAGRRTGHTPGGVVTEIPGSTYVKSDTGSAAIVLRPDPGNYRASVIGEPGQPFSLSMAVVDLAGDPDAPASISEQAFDGTGSAGPFSFVVQPRSGPPLNVITNGTVQLGVNPQGHLNVFGGPPSSGGTTAVGLRYVPTNAEATAPGCLCEGWGVADATTGVHGEADVDSDGVRNMTVESFSASADRAVSTVRVGGTFRVTHDYHPSATPNLFEATVTIENVSGAPTDVRYRRVMDWDVEPTPFEEFVTLVTIQGTQRAENVLFSSDDGFASANPLAGESQIRFSGDAVDDGPDDHGALFDFGFGTLAPGGSVTFDIYYGAAGTEADADEALRAVGAEVYSYGQPNTPDGPTLGTPNTFVFAFKGVGGQPAVPSDTDGDGVLDELDNCPFDANAGQADSDLNGIGDTCQTPLVRHSTAGFLQAGLDGQTFAEPVSTLVADEPPLAERLARIVRFRLDAGLADDAAELAHDLVASLVEAGLVPPGGADALVAEVLALVAPAPPVVALDFPAPTGANGWFTTSPVVGTVHAETAAGAVAEIVCTGASVGPATGLGTTAATAQVTVAGDGVHAVRCAAADAAGAESEPAEATVRIDTTAPALACAAAPATLWPPNHELVAVTATVAVDDAGSGPAGFVLASTASSEPDDGLGDGDTVDDRQGWSVGSADTSGLLRAERSGNGPGRTYALAYRGTDAAGNDAACTASVRVPHDRGG